MIKFSKEKVLLLHQLIAEETGGSIGVRDEALLESALENAFSSFDGQEFYPSKEEKGARLGYTLISNHAFVDGNKRIGMYVMLTFLEVNGIRLECTNEEIVDSKKKEDIEKCILEHKNQAEKEKTLAEEKARKETIYVVFNPKCSHIITVSVAPQRSYVNSGS